MSQAESFVYFAGTEWEVNPGKYPDILRSFARNGSRILWIDAPGIRAPSFSPRDLGRVHGRLGRFFRGMQKKEENIYVLSPLILPFPRRASARWLNARLQAWAIRKACKRLGLKEWIIWVCHPLQADVPGLLPSRLVAYSCDDEWTEFDGVEKEVFRVLERKILRRADLVFVTAKSLAEAKRPLISGDLHMVPNACNYGLFEAEERSPYHEIPEDVKDLPRPIIGYVGNIYGRMDFDLVRFLSAEHPTWSFVYIGDVKCDTFDVEKLPNVFFLGKRDPVQVVRYLNQFQVGIVPHKVNAFTRTQNIIKLFEYFAAGLPVVCVDLPEVRPYSPLVTVVDSYEAFSRALETSVQERDPQRVSERRQVAKNNTWEHRVHTLSEAFRGKLRASTTG